MLEIMAVETGSSGTRYYVNLLLPCFDELVGSLHFLALFWQRRSFVFIILQTLLQKTPGVGVYHLPKLRRRELTEQRWFAGNGHKPLDFDGYLWREH